MTPPYPFPTNYPQAASLKQVYNFKGNFSTALLGIFSVGGLVALVDRGNSSLPKTRVETSFDLGEATNQQDRAAGIVYDYYSGCKLTIRVCTERPLDGQAGVPAPVLPGVVGLHDEYCATAFALFEERLYPFHPWLAYYQVNMIMPRGTNSGLDARFLEDWTQITFSVGFGIRPSAWPAGS